MKQKLLLLLTVLGFLLPARLAAVEYQFGGINYDLTERQDDDGNIIYEASVIALPDGEDYSGEIVIPSSLEDGNNIYSVTTIGKAAFSMCSSLTSVEIPNSVTSIGDYAFSGCTSLTSVEIPNSVTSIGESIFNSCSSMISVEIGNSVTTIGEAAFVKCSSLTSVEIPNSVTSIGDYAFSGCKSLTSVEIPNSVTSIGESAFGSCSSLTSIEIPNSVTSIGEYAFGGCISLYYVNIPASVTSLGREIFNLSGLKLLVLNGSIETWENQFMPWYVFVPEGYDCGYLRGYGKIFYFDPESTMFMNDGTVLADYGKTLLFVPVYEGMSYSIPESVSRIASESFWRMYGGEFISAGYPDLSSITIPSSIEEIDTDAFLNAHIEKVNFTDWSKWYSTVKLGNLYSNPYWNSTPYVGGVEMVYPELPEGITEIPDYINYGLQFRDEIELPRTVKRIGAYAFYDNKQLYSVILPKGLEEIGESAFEGCELLENPSFPAGLKKIEDGAYKGCTSITEIELPEGLIMLGNPIVTGLENIDEHTAKGVFEGCSALERAMVAVSIDYLADNLFKDCHSLDKIYFPLELKTIGNRAFDTCRTLDEITFPASLEYIGERAFFGGDRQYFGRGKISKLVIPDNVKQIGAYAFAYHNITNLSIGKGLKLIPEGAFRDNPLKVVNFSEGLEAIEAYAFEFNYPGRFAFEFNNVGSVVLPSTVTTIGDYAFDGHYISSLVIPDEIETLGPGSCGSPSVLTLGSYVKNINAYAFSFDKLYTLRVKAHMPPTLSGAFPLTEEINDKLTLIVNKGRFSTYNVNARWKQIDRIIEEGYTEVEIYLDGTYSLAEEIRVQSGYMPSMVTKMMVDGPLSENDLKVIQENMNALTSLDLSNVTNLTELPANQFRGSLITEISLPDNLETIGNEAFRDCRLLKLSTLPASVRSIGYNAFTDCPEVNLVSLPDSLRYIGMEAFSNSGMQEVVAPMLLSEIRNGAFKDCALLERADFSMASLNEISNDVFSGCKELDEVILPSSVKCIGRSAFSNTALRNIDFVSGVDEIGDEAFSSNRRLVSATLPETITRVGSRIFENCPRLISVSMPMTTTEVGYRVLGNDRKLANLSCSAVEAPAAGEGAFDDVRHRYVTVTIPTLSFRKYLMATQWGRFDCLKNAIKVNMGRGVKATNAAENEYQDMLKEDALEAAQEAAAKQNGGISQARAMRRAAARANTPQNFASLFDGAQLTSWDGTNNRVFITPEPGVNVTSILFDGEEMIEYFDGESILLPEGRFGDLQIITDAPEPIMGDSNGSGELNIADAVNTANYAVGNEVENFVFETADVNADGEITLSDASGTVTLLLAQTVSANAAMKAPSAIVAPEDGLDALVISSNADSGMNVRLDSSRDYVALQADIVVPEDCELTSVTAGPRATGHSLMMRQVGENVYRVVLFDLGNRNFQSSDEALFIMNLTSDSRNAQDIELYNIVAADKAGKEYRLKSTTELGLSLVEAVDIDYCQPYEIYDLGGMKVADSKEGLSKGIYVVRQGNATAKIIVK